MGGKSGKLLCCSEQVIMEKDTQQVNRHLPPTRRTIIEAYQCEDEFEDFLVDAKTSSSSPNREFDSHRQLQQGTKFERFHLFSEVPLSNTGSIELQSSTFSRFEVLVEQLRFFFDDKPYLSVNNSHSYLASASVVSNSNSNLIAENIHNDNSSNLSFNSGVYGTSSSYERAYIEAKSPSDFTIYLKRETANLKRRKASDSDDNVKAPSEQSRFHTLVSEQIIHSQLSLYDFLKNIEENDMFLLDCTIQNAKVSSLKVIYDHTFENDSRYSLQIIHAVYSLQHQSAPRDLFYAKVIARISSNSLIQACESITPSALFDPLNTAQQADNEPRYSKSSKINTSTRVSQAYQYSIRSRYQANPTYVRAEMSLSGNVINFMPDSKTVIIQQLQAIDMKIGKQHYIQKQVLVHFAKLKSEAIKLAASKINQIQSELAND